MNKKLLVSLSAALISVQLSGYANAAYTERDVDRIEDLIVAGNWVDLRQYLLANPAILNGNDQFTEELRKFLEETDSLYTALVFDPSMFPNVNFAQPQPPAPDVVPPAVTLPAQLPRQVPPADAAIENRSPTAPSIY